MAKNYNAYKEFNNYNEDVFLTVDEGHTYKVNNSIDNVAVRIPRIADKLEKNNDATKQLGYMFDMLELVLGKDAVEYIKGKNYPYPYFEYLVKMSTAAVKGIDVSELEAEVKNQ